MLHAAGELGARAAALASLAKIVDNARLSFRLPPRRRREIPMKTKIHPQYREITVTCSCGNTWTTRSTLGKALHVESVVLPSVLHRQAEDRGHSGPRRRFRRNTPERSRPSPGTA
jgi:hypothetical protein